MPTGTRVCGCPSRRCSCGYDAGKKGGFHEEKRSVKLKGKRRPNDKGAAFRAKIALNVNGKLEQTSIDDEVEGNDFKEKLLVDTDPAVGGCLPYGRSPDNCTRDAAAASFSPKIGEPSKAAIAVKDEPASQMNDEAGSASSEKDQPFTQSLERRSRGSNVRTCGCPARKCRCGAGGRLIAGTPRSFLLLQSQKTPGDALKSAPISPDVAQRVLIGGREKTRAFADVEDNCRGIKATVKSTSGRSSGLVDQQICSCGNTPCNCRVKLGHPASSSNGPPSEDLEKKIAVEENVKDLKLRSKGHLETKKGQNVKAGRDAKAQLEVKHQLLPVKKKTGPGTGKRACGCPSRICRCGAQAPPPSAPPLPPLRPRSRFSAASAPAGAAATNVPAFGREHQATANQGPPAVKAAWGSKISDAVKDFKATVHKGSATAVAASAKPSSLKQPGPGTGRRACGCPARYCRCGVPSGLLVSRPKIHSKVKGKGKGPGTGRRLCGCPSRLCTCGAAALLSLPLAAPDNAGSSIQAASADETTSGKEGGGTTGDKEGLSVKTPNLEEAEKPAKKGPGTGRRACGCSARKCHCGARNLRPQNEEVDASEVNGSEGDRVGSQMPAVTSEAMEESVSVDASSERGGYEQQNIRSKGDGLIMQQENAVERRQRSGKRRRPFNAISDVAKIKARVRTQLNRMRFEKNLLDIYSRDGWQGSSREKLRPDSELERARRQVTQSKLAIRSAMGELHQISLQGAIDNTAFDGEGRINHEAIFCAKCKSSDIFFENDIILCDGDCNRAFHQNCLEPPLQTCDIPPGDEGWLCPACDCKIDCVNAINAATDANLAWQGCHWEEIFQEAVEEAEQGGFTVASLADEWPSDDSEDADYAPLRRAKNGPKGEDEDKGEPMEGPRESEDESDEEDEEEDSEDETSDGEEEGEQEESKSGDHGEEYGEDYIDEDGEDMDIEEREKRRALSRKNGRVLRSQGMGDVGKLEELPADWVEKVEEAEAEDNLVLVGKRKRKDVDYKKLNEELFGALEEEAEEGGASDAKDDDCEWGPSKQKRKGASKLDSQVNEEPQGELANKKGHNDKAANGRSSEGSLEGLKGGQRKKEQGNADIDDGVSAGEGGQGRSEDRAQGLGKASYRKRGGEERGLAANGDNPHREWEGGAEKDDEEAGENSSMMDDVGGEEEDVIDAECDGGRLKNQSVAATNDPRGRRKLEEAAMEAWNSKHGTEEKVELETREVLSEEQETEACLNTVEEDYQAKAKLVGEGFMDAAKEENVDIPVLVQDPKTNAVLVEKMGEVQSRLRELRETLRGVNGQPGNLRSGVHGTAKEVAEVMLLAQARMPNGIDQDKRYAGDLLMELLIKQKNGVLENGVAVKGEEARLEDGEEAELREGREMSLEAREGVEAKQRQGWMLKNGFVKRADGAPHIVRETEPGDDDIEEPLDESEGRVGGTGGGEGKETRAEKLADGNHKSGGKAGELEKENRRSAEGNGRQEEKKVMVGELKTQLILALESRGKAERRESGGRLRANGNVSHGGSRGTEPNGSHAMVAKAIAGKPGLMRREEKDFPRPRGRSRDSGLREILEDWNGEEGNGNRNGNANGNGNGKGREGLWEGDLKKGLGKVWGREEAGQLKKRALDGRNGAEPGRESNGYDVGSGATESQDMTEVPGGWPREAGQDGTEFNVADLKATVKRARQRQRRKAKVEGQGANDGDSMPARGDLVGNQVAAATDDRQSKKRMESDREGSRPDSDEGSGGKKLRATGTWDQTGGQAENGERQGAKVAGLNEISLKAEEATAEDPEEEEVKKISPVRALRSTRYARQITNGNAENGGMLVRSASGKRIARPPKRFEEA